MLRELLLASGQFALFYILLNFSQSGLGFFGNSGHVALLGFLLVQTFILVRYGELPSVRFFGSLIAPLIYTLLEIREGLDFILNAAHIWFWIFSALTGGLQTIVLVTRNQRARSALEFTLTVTNVASFLFLYFYFDTVRTLEDLAASGARVFPDMQAELTFGAIGTGLIRRSFRIPPTCTSSSAASFCRVARPGLGGRPAAQGTHQHAVRPVRRRPHPGPHHRGGEAKSQSAELCVLFSDIRNFTGISEANDPQAVTEMLNAYFSLWTRTIRRHGGIVDKFIGDAVMAIFGLRKAEGKNPPTSESPCDEAVACLAQMRHSLHSLQRELSDRGLPAPSDFGVGIHFGRLVIGDIGSEERKNFTVIGDTVNVASRLESASKTLETPCVISEDAYSRLDSANRELFRSLGAVRLKGKAESLKVYGYGKQDQERAGN